MHRSLLVARSSLALTGFLAFPLGLEGCGGRSSAATAADASSADADVGRETGIDAFSVDAANDAMGDVAPQDAGIDAFSIDAASDAMGDVAPRDAGSADAPTEAQVDASESCAPFEACSEAGACGGSCVQTVCAPAPGPGCSCSAPSSIVLDPANGTCECGIVVTDHCVKPQSHCLCTSCGDFPGALCVTDAEQTKICSGPFRSAFSCP
jgi:hypothetical protein